MTNKQFTMTEKSPMIYREIDTDSSEHNEPRREQRDVIAEIRRLSTDILIIKEDLVSLWYYYYNEWVKDLPLKQQRLALLKESEKKNFDGSQEETMKQLRQKLQTLEEKRDQLLFSLSPNMFKTISDEIDCFGVEDVEKWKKIASSHPDGYKIAEQSLDISLRDDEQQPEVLIDSIRAIEDNCFDLREDIALLEWYQEFLDSAATTVDSGKRNNEFREEVLYAKKHELDEKIASRFRLALRLEPDAVKKLDEGMRLKEEMAHAAGRELSEPYGFSFTWGERAIISAGESRQENWVTPNMAVLLDQFSEVDPKLKFAVFRPIRLNPAIAPRRDSVGDDRNKMQAIKCKGGFDENFQPLDHVTNSSALAEQIEQNFYPGTFNELMVLVKDFWPSEDGEVVALGSLCQIRRQWYVAAYGFKDNKRYLRLKQFGEESSAKTDYFLSITQ